MKVLIIDPDKVALDLAMQAMAAGHDVRLWLSDERGHCRSQVGDGLVERVNAWQPSMKWADLIILTDNSKYRGELRPFFNAGYPILGANDEAAKLELDRAAGQEILEAVGIETLPYETFSSFDRAIAFAKKSDKAYVVKPWGGTSDKALTYVSNSPADLVFKLERWKAGGLRGEIMLQEKADGLEMGVSGWFGPGGWSEPIEEDWEEKKLMNDGLGCNTGEMGTTVRYTKKSKLFDKMLKPLTGHLSEIGYVGDINVNCIIDAAGKPWPLEFTMRLGWPDWNIVCRLHSGDPVEWMLDLLEGRDTLQVRYECAVGVVMAHGDFPYDHEPYEEHCGFPITGAENREYVALQAVAEARAPVMLGKRVMEARTFVTAGDYVAVAVGCGATVREAQKEAYRFAWGVNWPSNRMFRTDVGKRLQKELPQLQEHGFATGLEY